MSFRPPKPPRFATASTPSRSTFVPVGDTPIRPVYGANAILTPQVDLITTTQAFAQLRPFRTSAQPQPPSPRNVSPKKDDRLKQHNHWVKLISNSVSTYLDLLKRSENLRSVPRSLEKRCECHLNVRRLEVVVVSFDGLETVSVCSCNPFNSLLACGYFPSAPVRPSVAFDVKMLEFSRELHLRSTPNRTAWSSAWEAFLRGRGYVFASPDYIRRKFTVAIRYYCLMQAETHKHVRKTLLLVRAMAAAGEEHPVTDGEDLDSEWVDDEMIDAEYLAQACPLCFAACAENDERAPAGVVVCLDACFVHKRLNPPRGQGRDPPLRHPRSVFLSEKEIEAARILVERARARCPDPPPSTADTVEPGMKLPTSTLDGCSHSFKAADEKRTKASSTFFADTGLMALLCRHDRVLWLVNMTTPGERQFYAIALIIKLFQALPGDISVGILYDIGCQLHRSCIKWNFIPEYIDRIIWGISIFHAYGHQWPCQLVYHPRKCVGFGMSDGEGCERFWSRIQDVIPTLRVSGYHQRIFTLDLQAEFELEQGMYDLAEWLVRKKHVCAKRRAEAEAILAGSPPNRSREDLRRLWNEQVSTQTRPLSNATANLAKLAVQHIILLTEYSKKIVEDIAALDEDVALGKEEVLQDAGEKRDKLVSKKEAIEKEIRRKRAELGVSEKAQLKRAADSKYIQLRMQARAMKERIRMKLQNRRFELERLDRTRGRASASERRLEDRVRSSGSSHEPSVYSNIIKFNTFCDQIEELIRSRKAPRKAIPPMRLDRSTVFTLDVDDPIWSDQGLGDDEDEVPPAWLADDKVREEIRALLTLDRCSEEECYLVRETVYLQHWFSQEWRTVEWTISVSKDDVGLKAYLQRYQAKLLYLGAIWYKTLEDAEMIDSTVSWGPSRDDFIAAIEKWWGKEIVDDTETSMYSSDSEEAVGTVGLEDLDWMHFEGDGDDIQEYLDVRNTLTPATTSVDQGSPRKRLRTLYD